MNLYNLILKPENSIPFIIFSPILAFCFSLSINSPTLISSIFHLPLSFLSFDEGEKQKDNREAGNALHYHLLYFLYSPPPASRFFSFSRSSFLKGGIDGRI